MNCIRGCGWDNPDGTSTPAEATRGNLCHWCYSDIHRALQEIPRRYADLVEMLGGRPGSKGIGPITSSPEPGINLDGKVVECRDKLYFAVATWARLVREERKISTQPASVGTACALILTQLGWLSTHPAVDELHAELVPPWLEAGRLLNVNDPPRVVGVCPCGGRVTARTKRGRGTDAGRGRFEPTSTCTACGTVYETVAMQAETERIVCERVTTADDLARTLAQFVGAKVPESSIRTWAKRGRLQRAGYTVDGRPTYRAGDVLDLVRDTPGHDVVAEGA